METGSRQSVRVAVLAAFGLIFGICAAYAFAIASVYTASIHAWAGFALLAAGIAAFVAIVRNPAWGSRIRELPWFKLFLIAQAISIPALIVVGIAFQGNVGTDYQDLADMATAAVEGRPNPHIDKYGAYPNNHLLLMCMIVLFGAVHALAPSAGQAEFMLCHVMLNIALIEVSFTLIAFAVRRLWGDRRAGITGLLTIACSPIWLNCTNPYSDTSSLLLIALVAWLVANFLTASGRARRIATLIAIGLACGVGFKIKATVAVLAVAFCLVALFMLGIKRALSSLAAVIVAIVVAMAGCNAFIEAVRPESMPYGQEERDRWAFPYVHWTMMSMNPNGDGTYYPKDYDFTSSFESYDEKQDACTKRLLKRVERLGVGGTLWRIAVQKPADLLRSGAFVKTEMPSNWVDAESGVGRAFGLYLNYAQAYHLAMLGLVALCGFALWHGRARASSLVAAFRHGPDDREAQRLFMVLFCMLALFGFMLFICGVWEAKARYPVHFLPLFLILEGEGLARAWKRARRHTQAGTDPHTSSSRYQ